MNRGLLALVLLSLLSMEARADEFVGIFLGPSYVNRNVGLKFGWGFETAGKLDPKWSLGFGVGFEGLGRTVTTENVDPASLTTFLGGLNYHALTNNRGPWVGIRGGVGVINNHFSIEGTGPINAGVDATESTNDFAYGLAMGYDKVLGDEWTWGFQAQYITVRTTGGSLTVINACITLRVWPE